LKTPPSDAFAGDLGEEALDHIEPGRRRRNEVEMKALVRFEPALDPGGFVRGVVVDDGRSDAPTSTSPHASFGEQFSASFDGQPAPVVFGGPHAGGRPSTVRDVRLEAPSSPAAAGRGVGYCQRNRSRHCRSTPGCVQPSRRCPSSTPSWRSRRKWPKAGTLQGASIAPYRAQRGSDGPGDRA